MSGDVFAFGPFQLAPAQRLLLDGDRPVPLGGRALDILIALVEHAGEIVSNDALTARVWPGITVEESNLRVHLASLRKALRDGLSGNRFISNVPGRGYSFVAPVEHLKQPRRRTELLTSEPARAHNLPIPHTRVIGRTDIVDGILAQLPQRRCITIVGPGGIGKTTVALAVAEPLTASYADGVAFVDLAPVSDPQLMSSALAARVGLALHADDPVAGLVASLREKKMLIVLDSCEHVIEMVAPLVEALLRGAPAVDILATSREPLRAQGEWVQRLSPLGLPPASATLSAAEALRSPAVQLFVERAAASAGGFDLADADAAVVAGICRRLDGIALAIEFAAGRVDAFGLQELANLLDDRFRVLRRGRRTALPRHQTLRATLDWSYELLAERERLMLRRLSIFPGGFSLVAAAEVAANGDTGPAEVGDLVGSLVAKSLVVAEVASGATRYRLLDTTRAYAREKLERNGELAAVARRHAGYMRKLFENAEAEWDTRTTAEWLANYAPQIDDLRAALNWAFSPQGDAAIGVALAAVGVLLWFELSQVDEGLGWIERALAALDAMPGQDQRRAMQLNAALGWRQMYATTRLASSLAAWRSALRLAEELHDTDYQLRALWGLWANRLAHEEYRETLPIANRFCSLAAAAGEPADRLVGQRMTGFSLHFLGDQAGARTHIELMLGRYIPPVSRSHTVRYHFDQRVTAHIMFARVLWLQGFADQALRDVSNNIEYAISINHTLSLANALAESACPVAMLAGDFAAVERYTEMLRRHATMRALGVWRAYADCFEGELAIRRGEPGGGVPLLRGALDALRRSGFMQYQTAFLLSLALGLASVGDTADGLAAVEEMLARCASTGNGWCLAEVRRVKGEILLLAGDLRASHVAEAEFLESLRIAREQNVLAWELRSATSLAKCWRTRRRTEALDLLASVYDRFSEGFGTADMTGAKTLLDELAR